MEKTTEEKNTEEQLVKQFDSKTTKKTVNTKLIGFLFIFVVLGIGSGFLIARGSSSSVTPSSEIKKASDVKKGSVFGSNDTSAFKDTAEGVLKEGGIEGEGQYHLERPGGESQYAYLTSSVVDLSLVKGRKVKVWGQTQKAQHAGWLMDVGKVEVLE